MTKPNIAVVVLDTLRKDAFDEQFGWLPGLSFENAWSTSHWTVPAHGSLFTGEYPSEAGVHAKSRALDWPGEVLTERLRAQGYRTRGFSANVNVSPELEFTRGFDEFTGNWRQRAVSMGAVNWQEFVREADDSGLRRYVDAFRSCVESDTGTLTALSQGVEFKLRSELMKLGYFADSGAREGLKHVRKADFADGGEFLYVNLMEAHHPYAPPRSYRSVGLPELHGLPATLTGEPDSDPADLRQAYRDSVRYLSDMYEKLFERLSDRFDYVVTLSDHGEMLGEHGVWEHLYGLYPELTHVPLVVSGDGLDGSTDRLTSIVDIHRTVLDWAGAEDVGGRGRHLLDESGHDELLTEFHGIDSINRETLTEAGLDPDEADGDLKGVALPPDYYGHETHDGPFLERGTSDAETPRDRLAELVESVPVREYSDDAAVSQSIRAHLEDLGYA
jgi:arylsulfatase A-like enzyme